VSFRALGLYENNQFNVNGVREQKRGYTTDYLNEYAVKFIEQPHSKPFVLYVGHKAPHKPYIPAARHEGLYKDAAFETPVLQAGDLESRPVLRRKMEPIDMLRTDGVTPEPQESSRGRKLDLASVARDRARCINSLDDGVGMIYDALERTGELDNTLIICTSDHGYLLGEHSIKEEKRWAWEPAARVPMVMRYPKLIPAGSRREQDVLNVDIAPTVLDVAGVKAPAPMHGKSLLPVFASAEAHLRDSFLTEYFLEKYAPAVPEWQCVRMGKWKYIHYTTIDGVDELYDLTADPNEVKNVIGEAGNAQTLSALKEELALLLAETVTNMLMV
jgi:N-acetylglucosamine-6-sulfatase